MSDGEQRATFEKWARRKEYNLERHSAMPDIYASANLNAAWTGWLAAQAHRAPDGYAYRYYDCLRFNNGGEVNGATPLEAVPYWLGEPAPMNTGRWPVRIDYKVVDGWHVYSSPDEPGLYVASKVHAKAAADVIPSLWKLRELDAAASPQSETPK